MFNSVEQERPEITRYRRRIETLHSMVSDWIGGMWQSVVREIEVNEEDLGRYSAPAMDLVATDGQIVASLQPVGASIIAADGRVDLVGELDEQVLVYLTGGGPKFRTSIVSEANPSEESVRPLFSGVHGDGWYWVEDKRFGRVRAISRELFMDLIREVSDRAAA